MISKKHVITLLLFCTIAPLAEAHVWADLWKTPDQQGQALFDKGNVFDAAKVFHKPEWKGVAYYRSGEYKRALAELSKEENQQTLYNRSLTYARLGDLEAAIEDLDRVIAMNPNNQKAKDNRRIFQKMKLEQRKLTGRQDKNQYEQKNKKQSKLSERPRKGGGPKPEDEKSPDELNNGKNKQPAPGKDQQDNQQQGNDNQSNPTPQPQPSVADQEQEQAKQQWLKRIPDDPGGLLREKFLRDYERRQNYRG